MTQGRGREPEHLSQAVTDLIALRGWAQVQAHARLAEAWSHVAGQPVAAATRVLGIRRGVLQVAVGNSPLLSELASYRKPALLEALARECPDARIRDLKFFMRSR